MDQKFHAAILAREKNRALLAAEMAKEDYGNEITSRIYKVIRFVVFIAVGLLAYKKIYDPTLALLRSNQERAEVLQLIKKEFVQAKSQISDGKIGMIGAAAPKANQKLADSRKTTYEWRENPSPQKNNTNSAYSEASYAQLGMLQKKKTTKNESKYRRATDAEYKQVKPKAQKLSSPYEHVGTSIPWALAKDRAQYPDLGFNEKIQ